MSNIATRRNFLRCTAATAATAAVAIAKPARESQPQTFLLVHGAWHSSFCWTQVAAQLAAAGHRVVAIDLPGHGINARYPQSYFAEGQVGLDAEPTAVGSITLDSAAAAVITALQGLQGQAAKPTLVGHSLGGAVITRAAELSPQLIGRLVYLTAFLPTELPSPAALYQLREAQVEGRPDLTVGDPGRIGAVRFNPRGNIDYLRKLHSVFYQDVPFEQFLPYAVGLSPDLPLNLWAGENRVTVARWGRIARTYIHCTEDRAIPPALQLRMIADADSLTPTNRTHVIALKSSHSPFAACVDELVTVLRS
jgi:pimeloyl-ACP methyl ester carboxylesterase